MEAGVAAELGLTGGDWDGVLGEGLSIVACSGVPEDVASESDAHRGRWSRSRPGEVGELDAESGGAAAVKMSRAAWSPAWAAAATGWARCG